MTQYRRDEKTGKMALVVSSTFEYKQGFIAGEKAEHGANQQVIETLRSALKDAADQLTRVHDDAFKQAAGYGLLTSDGRDFSCYELNRCQEAAGKARAGLTHPTQDEA